MDFVKKSIRAIGQLALQVPDVTPKAVQTLVELIQNKVDFVVQEVVVVMKVKRYIITPLAVY
jgi:vesicle coat complex subunit